MDQRTRDTVVGLAGADFQLSFDDDLAIKRVDIVDWTTGLTFVHLEFLVVWMKTRGASESHPIDAEAVDGRLVRIGANMVGVER